MRPSGASCGGSSGATGLRVVAAVILALMYGSALLTEFLAPYEVSTRDSSFIYAPPQSVHLFHEGQFVGPFVYGFSMTLNMEKMKREFTPDHDQGPSRCGFSAGVIRTSSGAWSTPMCIWCVRPQDGTFFLMGTDRLGRDMFSRIIYGTRISLTVGLLGIAVSFLIGIMLGGISGYYGGWIDNVIQRLIEIVRSFPELPLWMALVGGAAGHLEPDPDLLRHHHHPGHARLAGAGARRALEVPGAARGGFRHRRRADGRHARRA